jgi:prepilin-type N-terminal cleavage/methylation domain-containing protein
MKQRGFTLVEVALVIVVIGLLIGGFLKGKELITQAKIKNIESSFESVAKALYTYQERYHALPGDDKEATRFDPSIIIPPIQTQNGKIDGLFDSEIPNEESRLVWLHLRYAGLISKTFIDDPQQINSRLQEQPRNVFNGIIGVSNDLGINGAQLKIGEKMPGIFVGFTNIPGDIAEILDLTQDDGLANSGRVRSNWANYQDKTLAYKVYFYL